MNKTLLLLTTLIIGGCATHSRQTVQMDADNTIPVKEHLVMSVLWQQNAAEYRALCLQAFNQARYVLDTHLEQAADDQSLAIITDIDETILDNSPYSAQMIVRDENYNRDTWKAWGERESAGLVPGAGEFLTYAASRGVDVFYISNRRDDQLPETIRNLQAFNLPNSSPEYVLLRTDTSGKEARRQQVEQTHRVILLMGDNLGDFHASYDGKNSSERNAITRSMRDDFGSRYIVLPNPMYGDWETRGLYDGRYDLTEPEKRAIRREKLILP